MTVLFKSFHKYKYKYIHCKVLTVNIYLLLRKAPIIYHLKALGSSQPLYAKLEMCSKIPPTT